MASSATVTVASFDGQGQKAQIGIRHQTQGRSSHISVESFPLTWILKDQRVTRWRISNPFSSHAWRSASFEPEWYRNSPGETAV